MEIARSDYDAERSGYSMEILTKRIDKYTVRQLKIICVEIVYRRPFLWQLPRQEANCVKHFSQKGGVLR